MIDLRMQRLAKVLVNYSLDIQPQQWVGILADTVEGLPLSRLVYEEVVRAGGFPTIFWQDDTLTLESLQIGSEEQIAWVDPARLHFFEQGDAMVYIRGKSNTRMMSSVQPNRITQRNMAAQVLREAYFPRTAAGEFNWVLTEYPTQASAQEANMSLEEYEEFVFKATFCDQDNPVQHWNAISEMQQSKVDWLEGKQHIVCRGPNVDLELSIAGRSFMNSDGKRNMPSGEIFTSPVEDSANGWVRFTYPTIVHGQAVAGVELKFVDGKVVDASAEQNEELLISELDTDAGSRYLGEFAIGTNFGIQQFTGNILYDEKIGGTIHMALGRSYPETGGNNLSAIHWDMICDMRVNSEIHVDGDLFYRNGEFVV